MIALRPPRPHEAAALTELCLRSKAVWGYHEVFIQACRQELTLTPDMLGSSHVQVAERAGRLAGVVQIASRDEVADLAKLFVAPVELGVGIGRHLFEWAVATARAAGAAMLVIDADPNAAGFYRRMGAVDHGMAPSGSIPGRLLPHLTLRL